MRESERAFDTAIEAMANPYRRQLLVALMEHNPQADDDIDPLNINSKLGEDEALQLELLHNHLPKLEELEYITWNQDTREISKGPKWDEIAPLLELIHNHRDELPDGWL